MPAGRPLPAEPLPFPRLAERPAGQLDSSAIVFVLIFVGVFLLHVFLLRLPYFWDEAGYYIPAARDLWLTGTLIPHSTPSNAHPPLVMAYLALWWKLAGYSVIVTRSAMLLVAAFSLLGVFRLARAVANREVAIAATICVGVYPVFFAQSSLGQVDLAAAGLTFWGLSVYVERRYLATALWFCAATLAKETAILAPLALFGFDLIYSRLAGERFRRKSLFLLLPLLALGIWYAYHYGQTGYVFGNAEFFRYNVEATFHPLRIFLALLLRSWQVFGYLGLWLLTVAAIAAMWRPPLRDADVERGRISIHDQLAFLAVTVAYLIVMAVIGGAVLARYMLPVVPLVIIVWVSTLRRRVLWWRAVIVIVAANFVVSWFVNPPYGFSLEDNLAYRDYVVMHENAERFLEARYPMARVLTAWPASDEITRPYLGYVPRPMRVLRIENFSLEQMMGAADLRSSFDVALVFSTKYQPEYELLAGWDRWTEWKTRFFGYHRDVPAAAAAQMLGGRLVYSERHDGQWIGVIEMEPVVEAHDWGRDAPGTAGEDAGATARASGRNAF